MSKTISLSLAVIAFLFASCQKESPVAPKKAMAKQEAYQMPVSFASFSGSSGNGAVTISFSTTSEKNVQYFEIFSGDTGNLLCRIGTVHPSGNGTSSSPQQYLFVDKQPKGNPTYYMIGYVCANDSTYYYDPVIQVALSQ